MGERVRDGGASSKRTALDEKQGRRAGDWGQRPASQTAHARQQAPAGRPVACAIPHIISPCLQGPGTSQVRFAAKSNLPCPESLCSSSPPTVQRCPLIDRHDAPRALVFGAKRTKLVDTPSPLLPAALTIAQRRRLSNIPPAREKHAAWQASCVMPKPLLTDWAKRHRSCLLPAPGFLCPEGVARAMLAIWHILKGVCHHLIDKTACDSLTPDRVLSIITNTSYTNMSRVAVLVPLRLFPYRPCTKFDRREPSVVDHLNCPRIPPGTRQPPSHPKWCAGFVETCVCTITCSSCWCTVMPA